MVSVQNVSMAKIAVLFKRVQGHVCIKGKYWQTKESIFSRNSYAARKLQIHS